MPTFPDLVLPLPDGSQDTLPCQNTAAASEMRRLKKLCLSNVLSPHNMLVLWAKFYSDHAKTDGNQADA